MKVRITREKLHLRHPLSDSPFPHQHQATQEVANPSHVPPPVFPGHLPPHPATGRQLRKFADLPPTLRGFWSLNYSLPPSGGVCIKSSAQKRKSGPSGPVA